MKKLYTNGVILLMLALFFNVASSFAQILGIPDPQFSAPCASLGFNTYDVDFHWDPPLVASDNVFILELSDGDGNYDNAVELATISDSNTVSDMTFNFAFPTNTAGENFTVRVRSTNPAIISDESFSFPAYHVNVEDPLQLNDFEDAVLCGGSPTLVNVTNFPDETLYNWYKDNILIANEKASSLLITDIGDYYVEVDYGNFCSAGTASNIISAVDGGAGSSETVTISADGTQSCALAIDVTMTSDITDSSYTYTWFRNDVALTETSPTLITNQEGIYFLEIIIGQCPIYSNNVEVVECIDTTDATAIPNVLTPFRVDGINDQWIIPDTYAFNEEIEVIIYGPTGEILHQVTGYENNWPETTPTHVKNNPVFYYRILNGGEVLEQGSITLIK